MDKLKSPNKPFEIYKWEVVEAYRDVKRNQGAPGVDGQSIADFEKDLKGNLYKIWNRMSSGTYFPPPVRGVEIPKQHGGGTRMLGIPTVADRVAQTVVARHLGIRVDPIFHEDSYGYRPRRSALDAIETCRRRCWKRDWVIDLDIQKFFDSVRWDLIVKAVEAHTDAVWVKLYVDRWLRAPLQLPDGSLQKRDRGTPQGSAVSPVLANLFMHYAFDTWLARTFPGIQFERYADDAVVHCGSERQARQVLEALERRMENVGLRLHPDKTRIVYCRDGKRRGSHEYTSFTFLGYTFQAREAWSKQGRKNFTAFLPAISKNALKKISREIRSWRIHVRIYMTLQELARWVNPIVRGWMQYYGAYYRSALHPLLTRINAYLMRWVRKKYRRLRTFKKAHACWKRVTKQYPRLFAQWAWTPMFW
ncbi:group II intron reverse transcriptase/maturase [Streptomyces sp. NBC_00257]|uniref:group II intron reverse transcriptase/maturase n=1 Tax=unclassified Streptomyces TaxID=2593676 RepID=UPI002257C226|nr:MULTISPECIES: group II intron reverse transcriptase/maturase [unclassified Streptomyces]MCX5426488.1 group II intron reverse transcriptase/maturase [Streptomyces sp. NBC_00062]MCX5426489.1 group II intron reverse transcriptase/maturase [Streptomyces sp. NBC_00062]MCX5433108.1 group II intron reverse transcriptase/maturase [Streptomyces sp. NBC_00062]WTB60363.1 group II intron reverse transcriptase/maturase [Streptomyces sp. NBC_00826]